jgi:hypothetical protein
MSMPRLRLLPAALACALAAAAPAAADTTTLVGDGARSPVTIPGSGLRRGDHLGTGEFLVRRLTEVRAPATRVVVLRCPRGTTNAGLGVFETANKVGFSAVSRTYVGHANVRVRAYAAPGVKAGDLARASIFAYCTP